MILLLQFIKTNSNFEIEEEQIEILKSIISEIRNIRNNMNVHSSKKSKLIFVTEKYKDMLKTVEERLT